MCGQRHSAYVSQPLDRHVNHDNDSQRNQEADSHEHYNVDHTTSFLLFNPDLKLTALLTSPHEPKPMAEALDKIIETLR